MYAVINKHNCIFLIEHLGGILSVVCVLLVEKYSMWCISYFVKSHIADLHSSSTAAASIATFMSAAIIFLAIG